MILNPSFDDAGANPGEAAHWTLITSVASERIAGFGPEPYQAREDFERWFDLKVEFAPNDLAAAFSRSKKREDFEQGWGNDFYFREMPSGQVETCLFSGSKAETFERTWGNDYWSIRWDAVAAVVGIFDNEPNESFEKKWLGNENYARDWSGIPSVTAIFNSSMLDREDFTDSWTAASTI